MVDILVRRAAPTARPASVTEHGVERGHRTARWARAHLGLLVSGIVLAVAVGWAVAPSVFASGDPLTGVPAQKFQAPSAAHWFGTDNLGRDLYTRMVHGAGLSLTATLTAVGIALVVGSALGLLSGASGGIVDTAIMRVVDVLLSIPSLLLALALVTALGFGTRNVAIAVGVSLIANFARVMRSEVLRVRHAPYVEAAHASGVRWYAVLVRHVLPNAFQPVLALAAVEFGVAVLAVSSLSFLGYGTKPPTPEWGSLISEGRNFLASAWWLTTLPGLVIIAVVLSAQRLGRFVGRTETR
ncbi:peptide/nickel transport system permease protein [Nocardia alba]|uniref:Peptide/nickel transport system permease protein n=1 Tax=Nocardia alba TaxID=225051 RepID=A0A4R1FBG5_9NOCA|nr:peptide/nickel transport system permease protein [Nocardia alba]